MDRSNVSLLKIRRHSLGVVEEEGLGDAEDQSEPEFAHNLDPGSETMAIEDWSS
jgi:hypothetical protein